MLDRIVHLAVLDRDLAAPPAAPAEGQRWIIAADPTGAWAGRATHIAAWQDGSWHFSVPKSGWLAYVLDEGVLVTWNGSAWIDAWAGITAWQNLALLGIGTTADAANPLSARLNNALWVARPVAEGGNGNLQYKLSKESAANTLSFLFQTNFSGRAEIGLTGDDDLHVKVSADGSTYKTAMTVSNDSGRVSLAEHSKFSASTNYENYIAADTWTAIGFNTVEHNDQGDFNAGSNSFVAPHDGYYHFGLRYRWKQNGTNVPTAIGASFSKNGAHLAESAFWYSGTMVNERSSVASFLFVKLAAGDTIAANAFMSGFDGYVDDNGSCFAGFQIA